MSRIFWKFWSEISDLGSPKDQKMTLKFLITSKDPAKTVFVRKNRLEQNNNRDKAEEYVLLRKFLTSP